VNDRIVPLDVFRRNVTDVLDYLGDTGDPTIEGAFSIKICVETSNFEVLLKK
jgi:hypothetical protein